MVNIEYFDVGTVEIKVGNVTVMTFQINNRFQSNNSRRPKNLAVYVSVTSPARPDWGSTGNSISIPKALELLGNMELPTDKFIEMCRDQGWQDEISQTKMF